MDNININEQTRQRLAAHFCAYPMLQIEDVLKYLFQSSFGCEHLMASYERALEYIKNEPAGSDSAREPFTEELDGEYSRVHLSSLSAGLSPETLARLFCLSAKKEPQGREALEEKLAAARSLVLEGVLPFDLSDFDRRVETWREAGCPALHHSETFRASYRPAYRVISNRFAKFLQVFSRIDALLCQGRAIVALEGGSASGKTTLAGILEQVYDCNIFHVDDFFLRPEQRTPQRFAEVGGNVDRERFAEEILAPLTGNETVRYRPFNCSTQALGETVTVFPKKLTVIEGAYSMHPAFGRYYDLSVLLDVSPECQRERIKKRNSPQLARRFFEEWIPLEQVYFEKTDVRRRADVKIKIDE